MYTKDFMLEQGMLRFEAIMPGVIRCVHTLKGEVMPPSELVVPQEMAVEDASVLPEGLRCGGLTAAFDRESGCVTWSRGGVVLLKEGGHELTPEDVIVYKPQGDAEIRRERTVDGERSFVGGMVPVREREACRVKLHFAFAEGEGIFGLGQSEDGVWNWRGHTQYLYQHNMRIPMPFFLSSRGYGLFVDCGSLMIFRDKNAESSLELDTVEQLDYYLITGSFDEIIASLRRLTGRAPLLPKWAFGYIQCREHYRTAEELASVARRYRELGVPLDCVVQDWQSWREGCWGEKKLDALRYGDVEEQMAALRGMHVHTMVSVWPNMSRKSDDHREFAEAGHLLNDQSTYNAFDAEARQLYWKQAKTGLLDAGFDAWWCDSSEPFTGADWCGEVKRTPEERYNAVGGEHKRMLPPDKANLYAVAHARGMYEHQRADAPEKRMVNLTRSGYASSQRYGAVLWSGDISARWPVMKEQIAEALNMAASGYPWWTLDAGGFFVVRENWRGRGCGSHNDPTPKWFWDGDFEAGLDDLGFRELYVRWLQFAGFLPMFRSHGTDVPREIWQFGEPGTPYYDAIARTIRLRYRLMPYIYSVAAKVWHEDGLMIRPLLFDFLEDPQAVACSTQYMFGPSILVCPVTEPMLHAPGNVPLDRAQTWTCYLPAGCDWYDFWTNRRCTGGQHVTVEAPLDRMPLFVRAGSVIPLAEGLQYADQQPAGKLELRVYPGADAAFTLYEDAGDGYAYEQGEYDLTVLKWDEARQELTGMREDMRLRVIRPEEG